MASDQYDAPREWRDFITWCYIICNIFFALNQWCEFSAAGSFTRFWESKLNKFEVLCVVSGLAGVFTNSKLLMLIPSLRLYRLMHYLPTLEALLLSAVSSVSAIFNLLVFISIIAICVCITGRYIFRDTMDESTRSNYGSFFVGLLTTFQILTGDSWTAVLFASMSVKNTVYGMFFASLYTVGWYVFSSLVVFNLFVAVIIENFQVTETMENIARPGHLSLFRQTFRNSFAVFFKESQKARVRSTAAVTGREMDVDDALADYTTTAPVEEQNADEEGKKSLPKKTEKDPYHFLTDEDEFNSDIAIVLRTGSVPHAERVQIYQAKPPERVLFLFGPNNPIRRTFLWVNGRWWFDVIVYLAIGGSCAFLMITPPANDIPGDPPILDISTMSQANSLFTFIFSVEFFSRIMADGAWWTEQAYFKDWWNCVDFVVLFFAWVDEAELINDAKIAKVVRLTRSLRPLRLMKRNVNMRLVIDALIRTLPPVFYVIMFSVFTFMVFALIGMGLFGGKLYQCTAQGPLYDYPYGKVECLGQFPVSEGWRNGVLYPASWVNDFYSFDSFYKAGLSLFRVNTKKYVSLMFRAVDTTEVDQSPEKNHDPVLALFFIAYIMIGALFVMNLFVGFIVDGFNANKGTTPADVHYSRFFRQVLAYKPTYPRYQRPMNIFSQGARRITDTNTFARFSSLCVATNIIFMLTDNADAGEFHTYIIDTQNTVFFAELCCEVMLYLVGYGPGGFIDDPWKGFDLLVCIGTAMGPILNSNLSEFAKSFRLLRIVVLMNMIKPIRVILETLLACLPQLSNIIVLLMLVYSIFAVVAIQLFGLTKYGWRLGPTANFGSYGMSILTVFQMVTGDEWQDILIDVSVEPPECTPKFDSTAPGYSGIYGDLSFGDCGSSIAPVFFIIFMLVCEQIMLNLFVGMILDNFAFITDDVSEEVGDGTTWEDGSKSEHVQELAEIFKQYDGQTGKMSINTLSSIMLAFPQPMGFKRPDGSIQLHSRERAELRVIRAELNVILRQSQLDAAQSAKDTNWLKRIYQRMSMQSRTFVNSVSFEECMLTILHWRLPNMVPVSVQVSRATRVEEVGLMTYAIVIMEHFRVAHGRRLHRRTMRAIKERIEFRQWSLLDLPQRRRSICNRELRAKERELSEDLKRDIRFLMIEPLKTISVELSPLGEMLSLSEPHDTAVHKYKRKFPKPLDGLEVFLGRSRTDLVLLRYLDPKNRDQDIVVADFTEVEFEGWDQEHKELESTYAPTMVDASPDFAEKWVKIDMVVKAFVVSAKHKSVGSLLDIQSYNVDRAKRDQERLDEGEEVVQSIPRKDLPFNSEANVIRLNVGTYRGCVLWPDKETQEERERRHRMGNPEPILLPKFFNSVLEVVGYIPSASAAKSRRGFGKNKVSETAKRNLLDVLDDENTLAEHLVVAKPKIRKLRNMGSSESEEITGSEERDSQEEQSQEEEEEEGTGSETSRTNSDPSASDAQDQSGGPFSGRSSSRKASSRRGGGETSSEYESESMSVSASGDESDRSTSFQKKSGRPPPQRIRGRLQSPLYEDDAEGQATANDESLDSSAGGNANPETSEDDRGNDTFEGDGMRALMMEAMQPGGTEQDIKSSTFLDAVGMTGLLAATMQPSGAAPPDSWEGPQNSRGSRPGSKASSRSGNVVVKKRKSIASQRSSGGA